MTSVQGSKSSSLAYGVDPTRKEYYSLRQARYEALASDINDLAGQGKKIRIIDVGCRAHVLWRYLSAQPNFINMDLYGCDIEAVPVDEQDRYRAFYQFDLMKSPPHELAEQCFDVVVCEQVLEHLPVLDQALQTLEGLAKPGGTAFIGVPIFPPGLHLGRRYLVPIYDRLRRYPHIRGHVQAFSKRSFLRIFRHSSLQVQQVRGFRIISGGILRPLENYRWWWRFNCWLGALVPSLCIEIQVAFHKPNP